MIEERFDAIVIGAGLVILWRERKLGKVRGPTQTSL